MTDTTSERAGADPPPPYPRPPAGGDRGELATSAWRLAVVVGVLLALGVLTRASILVVVLAIVVMIFFHELGHYLTAKWSGMKVTEFFIGFGPRIWSFRRGETEYGLKAIPAGAYVRIIGMSNLEEVPADEEDRTYRQQSYPRRLSVAVAGSAMHFVMAFACLLVLLVATETPGGTVLDIDKREAAWARAEAGPWVIGSVEPHTAAERAGVEPGDRIVSIAGAPVERFEQVRDVVQPRGGEQVSIVVERGGETLTLVTDLGRRDGRGFLGIGPDYTTPIGERVPPHRAVVQAGTELVTGVRMATGALYDFFTGGIGDFASQVASGGARDPDPTVAPSGGAPSDERTSARDAENRLISIVGATRLGADLTDGGVAGLLVFLMSINIFIGIFNMIPLLPLDGGHVAIATYERIRSRQGRRYMADVSRLMPLTYAVVMVLIVLGLSSLYLDIVDPINI